MDGHYIHHKEQPGAQAGLKSALHMHVLVCICSNVRHFHAIIGMIQMCYHTNHCTCWPCLVNTRVFICYKTEEGTLMIPSFTRVTLRVLALLGQVTWTGTVCFRGRAAWGGGGATPKIWTPTTPPNELLAGGPLKGGGGGGIGGGVQRGVNGGGGVWIGLDWCFALFERAIPGSQVTWPMGP